MKFKSYVSGIALWLGTLCAFSQGTFIYDQQSSTETASTESQPGTIQSFQPLGQSFIPTLSSVGFVRLALGDGNYNNNLGATVFVNILANSINGPVISSTAPIVMADGFADFATFYFPTPVSVTPGTTYYFVPVVESGGDSWLTRTGDHYHYPGGDLYVSGSAVPNYDMWFREGIVVPEPSTWALLLVGGSALFFRRRTSK